MKFIMRVCHTGDEDNAWDEDYTKDVPNAKAEAIRIITNFNETLRQNERPRTLLAVTVVGDDAPTAHDWHKVNKITVITKGGGSHDLMRCLRCDVTGKRYGLGENGVVLDPKYHAKYWHNCAAVLAKRQGG
jgi:hypothetical protein